MAPPPAPIAEKPKSSMERMIGVLFSPEETFADIARKPDFFVVLLLIMVISTISGILLAPRLEFDSLRTQMAAKNPNMSPEDIDRGVKMAGAIGKVSSYASPVLVVCLFVIVAAVLLLAFRLFGGEGTFHQAFAIVTYAWIPRVLYGVILTIIVAIKGTIDVGDIPTIVKSSPAFLVDVTDHPVLFSLLSTFDIFTIWTMVLLIIGFAYMSRFTKARSATIIISIWAFITVVKLGFAAMGAARMKAASS
jgi:membrane protein, antimicrobial resistance system